MKSITTATDILTPNSCLKDKCMGEGIECRNSPECFKLLMDCDQSCNQDALCAIECWAKK